MSRWIIPLSFAALAFAQDQPVFRVGTRLVTVDAIVRTDKGPVRGLSKEDFTLQDKGKPQAISVFAVTESTDSAAKPEPLAPGLASNRMSSTGVESRTATVILFDRLNIPVATDQAIVRGKVLALLASLKPTDRIGFYSLGRSLTMVQDFSENAERMVAAAKRLNTTGQAAAPASDPRSQEIETLLRDALTPMQQQDITVRTAITGQAFQTIARHLAGIPGRKNLIWVASDFPLTYGESADRRTNYTSELDKVTNTLGDANIALYPMDPRGVTSSSVGNTSSSTTTDAPTNTEGGLMPGRKAATTGAVATGLSSSDTMQTVANATGGRAIYNTNDIGVDTRKVMDESDVTYTLGFYVDNKSLDGKPHDLNIKLGKKPELNGASVRYRKNYLAVNQQSPAAQQSHPPMNELIGDAFDATSIGILAGSAPDPARPGIHVVQVRVNLGDLQFERRVDKWVAVFDLGLAMEATNGKPATASVKPMTLSLSDAQLKQGLTSGLIVDNTIPSPEQPLRLRVVVQDKTSGAAGSVRIPLSPK